MLFFSASVSAQLTNIPELLNAGDDDAKALTEAYIKPFGSMLGRSLNSGWYNTASVHSVLGFDITLGINFSTVSSSDKFYKLGDIDGLENRWNISNDKAPTFVANSKDALPTLTNKNNNIKVNLPNGIGLSVMPMPIIQAGLGLPFHTGIIVRGFPPISLGKYDKVGLWGVGLKHDIKEDLPVLKHVPFFQLSGLVGYTNLGMNFEIEDKNHTINFNTNAFTARLITGIEVPVIAVYLGLGYGYASNKFDMKGEYADKKDPLAIDSSINTFDMNLGLRLKLGLLTLHGDYTFIGAPVISAGVGIALR
jgi:hypothetical protein